MIRLKSFSRVRERIGFTLEPTPNFCLVILYYTVEKDLFISIIHNIHSTILVETFILSQGSETELRFA